MANLISVKLKKQKCLLFSSLKEKEDYMASNMLKDYD